MKIKNLKAIREQNLMTQDELGKLAGIARETVNRIENGKSAHFQVIKKLSKALKVEAKELIG